MHRTISNVFKLRAAFQLLISACVHIHDQDARNLMGDLLVGILAEIRKGQTEFGVMQIWDVSRLPIDERLNTHWDPSVRPATPKSSPDKEGG